MHAKSLLKISSLTPTLLSEILQLTIQQKADAKIGKFSKQLAGKNFALIFEKPSTRTRSAFLVAASQEGASAHTFSPQEIHLGKKEDVRDTARVLSCYFDGIQYRGHSDALINELAEYSNVPVWNGLTENHHPTQALADMLTIKEEFSSLQGKKLCFLGDCANNTARSLFEAGVMLGMHVVACGPNEFLPSSETQEFCKNIAKQTGGLLELNTNAQTAVAGAHVLYTDVWVSMGSENQNFNSQNKNVLAPYYLNSTVLQKTNNKNTIVLHCLPAFKGNTEVSTNGEEISESVFESSQSRVFQQAENRLHSIRSLMNWSFTNPRI